SRCRRRNLQLPEHRTRLRRSAVPAAVSRSHRDGAGLRRRSPVGAHRVPWSHMNAVPIGDRLVGDGQSCYVIAEVGSNHNRDLDTARRLIDVGVKAGADAVKFQTYSGAALYSTKTPQFGYLESLTDKKPHELLEDISLPRDWQPLLAQQRREAGIEFLSSPFDRQAVD